MVCRRKMYVFVSELCVLGDIRQFLLAYCINIILYMTTVELSKRQQIVRTVVGSQELEGAPMDVCMRYSLKGNFLLTTYWRWRAELLRMLVGAV